MVVGWEEEEEVGCPGRKDVFKYPGLEKNHSLRLRKSGIP